MKIWKGKKGKNGKKIDVKTIGKKFFLSITVERVESKKKNGG